MNEYYDRYDISQVSEAMWVNSGQRWYEEASAITRMTIRIPQSIPVDSSSLQSTYSFRTRVLF